MTIRYIIVKSVHLDLAARLLHAVTSHDKTWRSILSTNIQPYWHQLRWLVTVLTLERLEIRKPALQTIWAMHHHKTNACVHLDAQMGPLTQHIKIHLLKIFYSVVDTSTITWYGTARCSIRNQLAGLFCRIGQAHFVIADTCFQWWYAASMHGQLLAAVELSGRRAVYSLLAIQTY